MDDDQELTDAELQAIYSHVGFSGLTFAAARCQGMTFEQIARGWVASQERRLLEEAESLIAGEAR